MKPPHDYVAVYDIGDDAERARVERILLGYGFRAQKSVFEIRTDRTHYARLVDMLSALHLETGFVRIYRLGRGARPRSIGIVPAPVDDAYAYVI